MDVDKKKERMLRYGWMIGVWAVIPSAVSLILGRSGTQMADLVRRICETIALFLSWVFFKKGLTWDINEHKVSFKTIEKRIRIFFAQVIFISAIIIVYTTINRIFNPKPIGNLMLGIIVALGDFIINACFWRRNYLLDKIKPSVISEVQWKLYRTKTSVNFFVLASLLLSMILKGNIEVVTDSAGSIIVALFLAYSGFAMLKEANMQVIYEK